MKNRLLFLFLPILCLSFTLQGCANQIDRTIFDEDIYGPWRSNLGEKLQSCYGRERQVPECKAPWKLEEQLAKNPQSAITPSTLEHIKTYALYAEKDTAATWVASGLFYQLKLTDPLPEPTASPFCRFIHLRVKPQNSTTNWSDLSRVFCFE